MSNKQLNPSHCPGQSPKQSYALQPRLLSMQNMSMVSSVSCVTESDQRLPHKGPNDGVSRNIIKQSPVRASISGTPSSYLHILQKYPVARAAAGGQPDLTGSTNYVYALSYALPYAKVAPRGEPNTGEVRPVH
jgi:hypothetical protein